MRTCGCAAPQIAKLVVHGDQRDLRKRPEGALASSPDKPAILLLAVVGFMTGRPAFLDIGLTYGLLNLIGTLAVLKFFRHGDLAYDVDEGKGS